MNKVIITAAISGAEVTKEQNPAVPYTVAEMAAEARRARDAGAAIVHLHVRWDDGSPTQDKNRFREVIEAIKREAPDLIVLPSTGGAIGMSAQERLQPTELFPEIATLDCGTCNFGSFGIFDNTIPMIREFGQRMKENRIKPEFECFEAGMVDTVLELAQKGCFPAGPMHFNLVVGVKGAMAATARNLVFLVDSLPKGSTWCATGIGRYQFPIAAMALSMGGNVRVGFEDNLYLDKGVLAKSNGELVEKAVRIARLLSREPASPDEARGILGLAKRNECVFKVSP